MMNCVTDWVENIVGKEKMLVTSIFLLFKQCFPKASCPGSLKAGVVYGKGLNKFKQHPEVEASDHDVPSISFMNVVRSWCSL